MADIEREPIDISKPRITVEGKSIELTPENTRLIKHAIGKVAIGDIVRNSSDFDHIRVLYSHEYTPAGKTDLSVYLFRGAVDDMLFDYEAFERASRTLEEIGVPTWINKQSVGNDIINKLFDHIESASHFETDDLDEDLNDLIDNYRRNNNNFDS